MAESINNSGDRIAFFLATAWGDGAERVIVTLANAIAKRDIPVDLVLFNAESYRGHVSENVRVVDLNASGAMASIPGLVRYIRQSRPKVIVSTVAQANLALLLARKMVGAPVKIVIREANNTSLTLSTTAGVRGSLCRWLVPVCYKWADALIAVSGGVADDMSEAINIERSKINVIYNPVALNKLHENASVMPEHPWFHHGAPPVIVSVGRMSPQKDFPNLLRAFSKLRCWKDARLIVLGDGEERPRLEKMADDLGISPFLSMPGYASNPHAYVARSALFVLSSAFEGLPNALIEAFALGVPVVSTDCECGPREILEGGRYGRLVPVGDSDALAQAMVETLDSAEQPHVPPEAIMRYDLQHCVDEYLRVINGTGFA